MDADDPILVKFQACVGKKVSQLRGSEKIEIAAKGIGISNDALSEIERGVYYLSLQVLVKIANYYQTTVSDLVAGDERNNFDEHHPTVLLIEYLQTRNKALKENIKKLTDQLDKKARDHHKKKEN